MYAPPGTPFIMPHRPFNNGPLGTGMLVKAEPGSILAATTHHKMDNGGGHSTDHQSAVALVNQPGGGQMVNGSSGGSQGGSSGRSSPAVDPSPSKLFVGGLSWQTTSDRLREYFGTYGTVKDVLIMKDPITQRSRGFGFITFGDPSSVEKVISVGNHVLDGKKIDPKHATPKNRGRNNRTKKIFVGGVSQETSAEEVKQYFSQFGKVEEAVMLMDNQTKRHRGFGFVTFECEDVVERVCEIHFHTIKNKKVECKKAQPKEAVQAASLLTKRLMLPAPGMTMAGECWGGHGQQYAGMTGMTSSLMSAQQAAAFASAQAAALSTYGKLVGGTYPPLSAYRYAPYPLPPTASAQHQTNAANSVVSHLQHQSSDALFWSAGASHHHQQQHQQHAALAAAVAAAPPPPSTPQAAAAAAYTASGHPHHAALTAATAAPNASHHTGHSMVATMPSHTQAVFTSPTSLAPPPHPSFPTAAQATLAASPYQGYSLANVDMSSFQGIDWSAMYGVGMYA